MAPQHGTIWSFPYLFYPFEFEVSTPDRSVTIVGEGACPSRHARGSPIMGSSGNWLDGPRHGLIWLVPVVLLFGVITFSCHPFLGF